MDLSKYYEEFRDAILHAFPNPGDLEMAIRFEFDVDIDHVVRDGTYPQRVFELIEWADSEEKSDALFAALWSRKPRNLKLSRLAEKLAGQSKTEHIALAEALESKIGQDLESDHAKEAREMVASVTGNNGLQALVTKVPNLQTGQLVNDWRDLYQSAERRICSIGGKRSGTGFLVGADRIMTNGHVIKETDELNEFEIVFDYVKGSDRSQLDLYRPVELLAWSAPRELDVAILKLDQTPNGNRGHFTIRDYDFESPREPLIVLGHPNGEEMRLAFGVLLALNGFMGRIAYTNNTAPGSSGSPVFTENWDLVAIHHQGEENMNNNGIPMKTIVTRLDSADQLLEMS